MFSVSPGRQNPASRARFLLLVSWLTAVLGLFLAPPMLLAQNDELITPIGGSLGDPIYTDSDLTGPSSSLFQGSNSLLSPNLHTDISDPLDFLIESSFLSPYDLGGSLVGGYVVDSYIANQVIVDATLASRFSEYQNNRYLMSGTVAMGSLAGRATAAGSLLQSNKGIAMSAAGGSSFGSLSTRAPFAAGSSLLAGRQSALSASGNFMDPNAMVSVLTSSAALNSMQGLTTDSAPGAATSLSAADSTALSGSSDEFGSSAGISYAMLASVPAGMMVPPPDGTAIGPEPGSVFIDVSMAMPSTTGFPDSTQATAGSPSELPEVSTSPLASSHVEAEESPFRNTSGEETNYLNPTLMIDDLNDPNADQSGALTLSEATRKARMHAMIYNPQGSPLPSPFEQRALQREFLRNKNKHHTSHYPALVAPSVTH
jgi:hypothetical protein